MKRMYTTNNARSGTSGVVDVLFNMTISLVTDATHHAGSGKIGTVLFSRQDGWSPWSPQASYDRRRHRNCFTTRKSTSISEKVNIS